MSNHKVKSVLKGSAVASLLMTANIAAAVDVSFSGFIRQEMAYNLSDKNSRFNQQGNIYNGVTVDNNFVPGETFTRPDITQDNDWNLMATRIELDTQITFNEHWDAFIKLRAFVDNNVYNDSGNANFFEVPLHGDCGTALEICDENYMIDLPSFYLDYNNGPIWLRFGNQQIAWGEALFFRVADVANGLDLRRHSFLDYMPEEYADERVAAPGIRGSYRINEDWEIEAFTQMFSPSILSNENTPYNVVFSSFFVQQKQFFDNVDDSLNAGLRLRGQLGDLGLQFFAVNRRNPDGVFRWTESNVGALSETPFEYASEGVYSSEEWFSYAGASRLDGVTALDSAILEFQQALDIGGFPITGDPQGVCGAVGLEGRDCAEFELDSFYTAGSLRGHLAREYKRENIFGWGFNYLFFDEPDTLLDQLVVRFEMSFTPDKQFTNTSLSREYIEEDEFAASLVFEKYHRFSESLPATFMVLEYMYKSESDMYGRHLSGSNNDGIAYGEDNFHAFAFAMQQASPTLLWRFDLSVLYDVQGGLLVQPAVRYKPNADFTIEAYATILDSDGGNDDIIETFEDSDEIGLRIGYQF
jgi:hypothetical protein